MAIEMLLMLRWMVIMNDVGVLCGTLWHHWFAVAAVACACDCVRVCECVWLSSLEGGCRVHQRHNTYSFFFSFHRWSTLTLLCDNSYTLQCTVTASNREWKNLDHSVDNSGGGGVSLSRSLSRSLSPRLASPDIVPNYYGKWYLLCDWLWWSTVAEHHHYLPYLFFLPSSLSTVSLLSPSEHGGGEEIKEVVAEKEKNKARRKRPKSDSSQVLWRSTKV